MQTNMQNPIASSLDDPELFVSMKRLRETIDAQTSDDFVISNPMEGILIAIPISLAMWAGIILGLVKLFSVLK